MAEHDFFADIALTQHPFAKTDKEIEPQEQTDKVFRESSLMFPYGKILVDQDMTQEEKYRKFQKELSSLKRYYAPFLENHLPEIIKTKQLELKKFKFRYRKQHEVFTNLSETKGKWEKVEIPDYRGPAGSEGKWQAYYKTTFKVDKPKNGSHAVMHFQCVDYEALIYLNGNYVGGHEGFFAPFEIDVTDYLAEENELIIEVHNDVTTKGDDGPMLDGDKIYAATGPGWDDPYTGWHHCPAGAGVFGRVYLEERPVLFVNDIFARPDIDKNTVELRMGVMNYEDELPENLDLEVLITPKNFEGEAQECYHSAIKVIGRGKNEYRYSIPMVNYKLWSPDTPYLYGLICTLKKDGKIITQSVKHFGMRSFTSDETSEPKGKFYLNHEPIILRGANEMGHLQQCVMQDDLDQLEEDILIGKLCNMNYYRITQRPVQEEIYDYMDMLGMMVQTDFPLFSTLRRNQVCEAVKQVAEMEHLVRCHPSVVMETFINEPVCIRRTEDPESKFSKRYDMKGHRHLFRDELEAFFAAARKMIYIENPDRVIKNVEGDYDPPTAEGMPDFHTYTMWYTNHPISIGKLSRGYIPPVKPGWMIGCGEYGAEGLDNENIMLTRYPKEWIAKDEKGDWYPSNILHSQMNAMHGDWFAEQTTMKDWIRESQIHQANATKLMTDAFRRRADFISQTAIHLLIDAWPAGWMKTLVGCDRVPKLAYYAYKEALIPYKLNLRCDRKYVYSAEKVFVEAWVLNDTPQLHKGSIVASVQINGKVYSSYSISAQAAAVSAECAGIIPMTVPEVTEETTFFLDSALMDEKGQPIHAERMEFIAYPPASKQHTAKCRIETIGEIAEQMAQLYGYKEAPKADRMLVTDIEGQEGQVEACLNRGGSVVVILPGKETVDTQVSGINIVTERGPKVFFAAATSGVNKYHFNMLYNKEKDYLDFICRNYLKGKDGIELVYTYGKQGEDGRKAPKEHYSLVRQYRAGNGILTVASIVMEGKAGQNANLDQFFIDCLENKIRIDESY